VDPVFLKNNYLCLYIITFVNNRAPMVLLGSFIDMKFEIMTFLENFRFLFYLNTNALKNPRNCFQIYTKFKPLNNLFPSAKTWIFSRNHLC